MLIRKVARFLQRAILTKDKTLPVCPKEVPGVISNLVEQ
jgi:hypothetical protein